MPSVPWRVESSKIFKKIKKVSNFLKCTKSFPKVSKSVLNVFWGKLFEKFLPSFPWKVESSKIFKKKIKKKCKIPKMPKIVPKSIQTCFELVLGQIFRKFFCPVFRGGSSFRKFSKKIFSNFQKCPKVFPKVSKHVLNVFWGKLFEKFLPSFPWKVESSKIFKKIKKFAKFQKCPKSFPKVSKRVLNLLWVKLFENFFAQCSMEARDFEKLQKKSEKFQNDKNAQNCCQKYPNVF